MKKYVITGVRTGCLCVKAHSHEDAVYKSKKWMLENIDTVHTDEFGNQYVEFTVERDKPNAKKIKNVNVHINMDIRLWNLR